MHEKVAAAVTKDGLTKEKKKKTRARGDRLQHCPNRRSNMCVTDNQIKTHLRELYTDRKYGQRLLPVTR
jgi:hypothetical protein